jgi:hypothetical protein
LSQIKQRGLRVPYHRVEGVGAASQVRGCGLRRRSGAAPQSLGGIVGVERSGKTSSRQR